MNVYHAFAPAKVNLFLAITGRRADGFHDLVSVVAPLKFGDELLAEVTADPVFTLQCDAKGVPTDESNLVLRAARLFEAETGRKGGVRFTLSKKTPAGAGLGGGSSDGTAALVALNKLAGDPLGQETLARLAAQLGSDCPLFLHDAPCAMRGRGETITALPAAAIARMRGRRLLLFKPPFGINTGWAYKEMAAAAPGLYLPAPVAEQRLHRWIEGTEPLENLIYNNMESVAFRKFLALPTLLQSLRERFGVAVGMSGSGSCCFAILRDDSDTVALTETVRAAWGSEAFVCQTQIR